MTTTHTGDCFADFGFACSCNQQPALTPRMARRIALEACQARGHLGQHLGVIVAANGVRQVYRWCPTCDAPISTALGKRFDEPGLPVMRDNRSGEPCEVCGARDGVEEHRYWPWSIFGDLALRGHTGMLCRGCHRLWHDRVTPNISRRGVA